MEDLSYINPNSPTLRQSLANVLRGMTKKEDYQQMGQAIQNTAQVMPSVLESLARGGIAQVPGTVGDISQTARDFFPQTMQSTFGNRVAPTTEEILQAVPRINPDYQGSQQHEMVGGLIAPALGKILKMGAEATKGMKGGLSIEDVSNYHESIPYNRKELIENQINKIEPTITVNDRNIPITLHPIEAKQGNKIEFVNTDKFENAFKKDETSYIGKNGTENAIGKRYEGVANFLKNAKSMNASQADVKSNGTISFGDGRHRFSYLRDLGLDKIPISMDAESIKNAKKYGYID